MLKQVMTGGTATELMSRHSMPVRLVPNHGDDEYLCGCEAASMLVLAVPDEISAGYNTKYSMDDFGRLQKL